MQRSFGTFAGLPLPHYSYLLGIRNLWNFNSISFAPNGSVQCGSAVDINKCGERPLLQSGGGETGSDWIKEVLLLPGLCGSIWAWSIFKNCACWKIYFKSTQTMLTYSATSLLLAMILLLRNIPSLFGCFSEIFIVCWEEDWQLPCILHLAYVFIELTCFCAFCLSAYLVLVRPVKYGVCTHESLFHIFVQAWRLTSTGHWIVAVGSSTKGAGYQDNILKDIHLNHFIPPW